MARLPKMAHLTLIASLLGGAAIVPVILSGQASAQAGSRICGREWRQNDDKNGFEVIFKIYEIDKEDPFDVACTEANSGGSSDTDPTLAPSGVKDNRVYSDWRERSLYVYTCEEFTKEVTGWGSLEFKEGETWSNPNQDNICNTMNKSNDVVNMKAYWLMLNKSTNKKVRVFHG